MKYSSYKFSGADWLGEIPSDWKVCPLKYIFTIKKRIAGEPGHTVLSITQSGIKPKDMSGQGQFAQDYSNYQLVYPGDFAMNHMDLLTGWVDLSKYEGVTSPDYRVFINNDDTTYLSEYYKYIFQYCYSGRVFYGLGQGVSGFGRWRLPAEMFLNFRLPVPPKSTQETIVQYLNRKVAHIDSVIAEAKASIEEYKAWKASVIYEAVTKGLDPDVEMKDSGVEWIGKIPSQWKLVRMKNLISFMPKCDYSFCKNDTLVTFTPMECIRTGTFENRSRPYGDIDGSYTQYAEGDIVLAKVTPCFENGNVCIMSGLYSGVGFGSSELFVLRPQKVLDRFLLYFLQHNGFKDAACSTMTGTGGLKRVSSSFIQNCYVPYPDMDTQKEIADYLDRKCSAIQSLICEKESLIADLEAYKKSLIFEVVTGKIKVV